MHVANIFQAESDSARRLMMSPVLIEAFLVDVTCGVSVTYDKEGFPDFTPHRHPTVKDVQIEFTGRYKPDETRPSSMKWNDERHAGQAPSPASFFHAH